eukprot:scaffold147996_cov22-Tisochrysis_lutea.AAC.2
MAGAVWLCEGAPHECLATPDRGLRQAQFVAEQLIANTCGTSAPWETLYPFTRTALPYSLAPRVQTP